MFRKGVTTELRWLVVYLMVALALGVLMNAVWITLFFGALVFIGWLLYQVYCLESWVARTRQMGISSNSLRGIWSEIAEDVELMHKRAEKEKQRLQGVVSRVQDMTSALADGVIIVDKRDNIEWWNSTAERLFDFGPLDLGHKISNYIRNPKFIAYYDLGIYDEPLSLTLARYEGQSFEFHIHGFGDGDRLVIARNITRLANLERMRKDFVANVSHELRTPLTVLGGYLETMADASEIPAHWKKALNQMQDQTRRMASLVKDLLMLSRLETEDREAGQTAVRLRPLLEQIVADAKVLSGDREHRIFIECEDNIQLLGMEQELRSAFTNLVCNAVSYTPARSKITVQVELNPLELIVKVKDNGEGIDAKHIPRLTERFYRVDDGRSREQGGTGLGLAIVKHIILRHDGELRIRSKPGKGTTFSCQFPLRRFLSSVDHEDADL